MDTISSLSSGLTNTIKDVLGLSIAIISYDWMVNHVALFNIQTSIWLYILAFIGLDFAGYWSHRWSHEINVFWNRHIIHHSSEEFNLACALRQSISNIFAIFTFLYLPMALLGVPTKVVAIVAPIQLFAQFWYHTRLINKMGFLEKILVTPSHHRVHHAINPQYIDKNYSQIFIFWDKLFGTFQPELENETPIYGVKKAVKTWNPFLINWQHYWLLITDAWRTRNWWDKVRIWFMPTGWRPADVSEKYPVDVIQDVHKQVKYETPATSGLKMWSWTQLVITMVLMLYLFNQIADMNLSQLLWYGLFLGVSIFGYTALMDRSKLAIPAELIKITLANILIYINQGWFGIDTYLAFGTIIIQLYLIGSVLIAFYFTFFDKRFQMSLQ
jgi:sterol desaturase/sphingolipid hydroxylase (fatty acid hydroxylase superfamily)